MRFTAWLAVVSIAVLAYAVFAAVYAHWPAEGQVVAEELESEAEEEPELLLHVHPRVQIIVFGAERVIPAGVGIYSGNNIDNDASGVRASPVHTHAPDNVLHVEVVDESRSDVLTLGYFFNKVWGQKLSSECVFEYCIDEKHSLKMFVDGIENTEFEEHLLLRDEEVKLVFGVK